MQRNDNLLLTIRTQICSCRRATRVVRAVCPSYRKVEEILVAARDCAVERQRVVDLLLDEGSDAAQTVVVAMFIPQIVNVVERRGTTANRDELSSIGLGLVAKYVAKMVHDPREYSLPWYISKSMHRDLYREIDLQREGRRHRSSKDLSELSEDCLEDSASSDWFDYELKELTEWVASEAEVSIDDATLVTWSRVSGTTLTECSSSEADRYKLSRTRSRAEKRLKAAVYKKSEISQKDVHELNGGLAFSSV